MQNNLLIKKVTINHPQLIEVISDSIGDPTITKINSILLFYQTRGKLIGAFIEDSLVGCLGYELEPEKIILKHLSVAQKWRRCGIGGSLVNSLVNGQVAQVICAHTDIDSLSFYKKLGFQCKQIDSDFARARFECIYYKN